MKNVVILKHFPGKNIEYLCLLLDKVPKGQEMESIPIVYEEESDFDGLRTALTKAAAAKAKKKGNRPEGFAHGYYFKYLRVTVKNVVAFYRNKIEFENQKDKDSLYLNNNMLSQSQLTETIKAYDYLTQ